MPIAMARKPLIGTVEANWREHGTGALNIDGCRVAVSDAALTVMVFIAKLPCVSEMVLPVLLML